MKSNQGSNARSWLVFFNIWKPKELSGNCCPAPCCDGSASSRPMKRLSAPNMLEEVVYELDISIRSSTHRLRCAVFTGRENHDTHRINRVEIHICRLTFRNALKSGSLRVFSQLLAFSLFSLCALDHQHSFTVASVLILVQSPMPSASNYMIRVRYVLCNPIQS